MSAQPNLTGYWTGSFEGTNLGGVSLGVTQQGTLLGGVATTHEAAFGICQYVISGNYGAPIRIRLNPAEGSNGSFGVVDAVCSVAEDGTLTGRWATTAGTNGAFTARRYEDPTERTTVKPKRTSAFVSYCHVDADFLDELKIHLRPLERAGQLDLWSDQRIKAGSLWKKEIESALARAHVAILLISPDFLASDFIVENELPPVLTRARDEGVRIVPVLVRTSRFTRDPNLGVFQAVNDPKRPLAALARWERDEVFDRIAHELESGP